MPSDAFREACVALNRFGLGARPGDLKRAMADPRGLLKAELQPDKALIDANPDDGPALGGTTANIQIAFAAQMDRKMAREQMQATQAQAALAGSGPMTPPAAPNVPPPAPGPSIAMSGGNPPTPSPTAAAKPNPAPERPEARIFRTEALARFRMAAEAETGILERLVAFWSNHFCVSVGKGDIDRVAAGSFEREAIRPYVLGRFADMVMAVEHHPAMLYFLDNAQSVGPGSRAGQNRKRGLNENLAREILELHTLGVDAGYTQTDVTSMARIITGWTFAGREGRIGEPGTFVFNANMHEPGDQMVAGHAYLANGFGQGEAALGDIARNPATAHHVATKLVRHFIADEPPPGAVDRIAAVFRNRDGDLKAVTLALIDLPEAWSAPPTKIRNPYEFLMAAIRLLALKLDDPGPVLQGLRALGMPLWEPPGPNGFPDVAGAWLSPEGMKLRLDVSARIAHLYKGGVEPMTLLDAAAGEAASDETRSAIAHAESKEQAVALLLMTPEFQRR